MALANSSQMRTLSREVLSDLNQYTQATALGDASVPRPTTHDPRPHAQQCPDCAHVGPPHAHSIANHCIAKRLTHDPPPSTDATLFHTRMYDRRVPRP